MLGIQDMIETRYYKTVSAVTTDSDEYTPANGEKLLIVEVGGNAAMKDSVHVKVLFDTTVLFCTHGDSVQECTTNITGDGSKKLKISLVNDSLGSETIGGYYKAVQI